MYVCVRKQLVCIHMVDTVDRVCMNVWMFISWYRLEMYVCHCFIDIFVLYAIESKQLLGVFNKELEYVRANTQMC